MSKVDVLADIFNTSHKKNYATGKFEPVNEGDDSIVAEDTYALVSTDSVEPEVDETEEESVEEQKEEIVEYVDPDDEDYLVDEEEAKRNIKTIIENGMDLMEDLCENVRDSEQPKSFEYAAVFMKTLVEMNEKMLDIHDRKKKRKNMNGKQPAATPNISQVNNNINIYESSPTNILKQIKGKKNNNES